MTKTQKLFSPRTAWPHRCAPLDAPRGSSARHVMSAVSARRIAAEVRDLAKPSHRFTARPVRDDDLREWHFTIRGPPDSDFAGGVYHGRISLPAAATRLASPSFPAGHGLLPALGRSR